MSSPTFHVLIATVGRPSLQTMLNSLLPQLRENDHLTIVFDGKDEIPATFDLSVAAQHCCRVHQHCEPRALGFWGHGIRNKYASLSPLERTTFVMHADDDDTYYPGIFDVLRHKCTDPQTLYIMRLQTAQKTLIPHVKRFVEGDISTQNGIIPYDLNGKSKWEHRQGGDADFYKGLVKHASKIVFLFDVGYWMRADATQEKAIEITHDQVTRDQDRAIGRTKRATKRA